MSVTRRDTLKATLAALIPNSLAVSASLSVGSLLVACGGGGSTTSGTAPSALSYPTSSDFQVGVAIAAINPSVTGDVASYTVSPALPAGLVLDSKTGQITGTPTAASPRAKYVVKATNLFGSTTFDASIAVIAPLAILLVSKTNPTALTPVTLSMSGLDATQPFTVAMSNASGYSLNAPIVRVATDGSVVVVAAPYYLDPATGQSSALTVSIAVTQGGTTSNGMMITVADLPTVASYGVQPGDISRAFMNQLAIGFAVSANGLQAMAARPQSKTDTSTVRGHLVQQQQAALEARDNVDLIVSGAQTKLSIGTTSAGSPIQFDANSVDSLDRVLAVYLQYLGVIPTTIYTSAGATANVTAKSLASQSRQNTRIRRQRVQTLQVTRLPPSYQTQGRSTAQSAAKKIVAQAFTANNAINVLGTFGGALGVANSWVQVNGIPPPGQQTTQETVDKFISIGQGVQAAGLAIGGALTIAGFTAVGPILVGAAVLAGTLYGVAAIANDGYKMYTYSQALDDASLAGDTAALTAAQEKYTNARDSLALDTIGTGLGLLGFPGEIAEGLVAKDIVQGLLTQQTGLQGLGVQGLGLIQGAVSLLVSANGAESPAAGDASAVKSSNTELPTGANSFGLVEGTLAISNTAAPDLVPLGGVKLIDPTTGATLQTSAGVDNNYQLVVPLGVPGMDYGAMQIEPYDPVTNTALATPTTIDLSSLNVNQPFNDGTIVGVCSDNDASTPDQDDPDCD